MIVDALNKYARKLPEWPLYIIGMVPALWFVWLLFNDGLGVDPVRGLEHRLGKTALQLLVAGLAVTPLRCHLGINLLKFRRALGLLAFTYVALHLAVWLALDIQFLWGQIWKDILKRPYITLGMSAFVMMLPLAATSNKYSLRRLSARGWRRLHKLTYLVVLAGALHYVWLVKGWQTEPLIYLGTVLVLLALRIRLRPRQVTA